MQPAAFAARTRLAVCSGGGAVASDSELGVTAASPVATVAAGHKTKAIAANREHHERAAHHDRVQAPAPLLRVECLLLLEPLLPAAFLFFLTARHLEG